MRRIAVALALALLVASSGSLADPERAAAWDEAAADPASEAALVGLTNASRASAGLPVLALDEELAAVARWRSRDMAERDYFGHRIPPDGRRVFDALADEGYCFEVAGENIGWLAGADAGAEAAIQGMFIDSDSHRRVLMGDAWDVIGVGTFKRADGRKYWTVLFADRCVAS